MNVPKPLTRVRTKDRFQDIECFIHVLFTQTVRVHDRILRHVLYHSAAKSEKETCQLATGS